MPEISELTQLVTSAASRDELRQPIHELAILASGHAVDGGAEGAGDTDAALAALLGEVDRRRLGLPAIRRQLFNATDQEDVEQDLLLAIATSISGFRGDANFLTWMHTVATNCALAFVRRRRDTEPLEPVEASVGNRFTSIAAQNIAVQDAIAALPPKYRDAVTLRDLEQATYAEVADRLGLNLNTARAHIARGRALVADSLALELS